MSIVALLIGEGGVLGDELVQANHGHCVSTGHVLDGLLTPVVICKLLSECRYIFGPQGGAGLYIPSSRQILIMYKLLPLHIWHDETCERQDALLG